MPDPRVAVHRLRSLVEMLARDERIPAEFAQCGVDRETIMAYATALADDIEAGKPFWIH